MDTSYPECDSLPTHRKRQICRNESELPLGGKHGVNAYRRSWGLDPIPEHEQVTIKKSGWITQNQDNPQKTANQPTPKPNNRPGWGDRLSSALATVGVTEDRVSSWLGRPCGCKARRERLNRLGEWAEGVLSGRGGSIEDVLKS